MDGEEVDSDDVVIVYFCMESGGVYSEYLDRIMQWVSERNMHATLVTSFIHWPRMIEHVWLIPDAADRLIFTLHWV